MAFLRAILPYFLGMHSSVLNGALARGLSFLGLGLGIAGIAVLVTRGEPVQASPAPLAPARRATCPPTWQVFSTTATLIQTLPDGVCPTFPCGTPFGQGEDMVVDLDGDGRSELLTCSERASFICADDLACVALRRAAGTLRLETVFGGQPLSVPFASADQALLVAACVDVTGDRLPDLVFKLLGGAKAPDAIGYFANILPPPSSRAAADLNGDGTVGSADLTIVLNAWGPVP